MTSPMTVGVVQVMGLLLPRTEVLSLLVVGLVLGAWLVAVVLSLVEERQEAKYEPASAIPLWCEGPIAI
jgi:hypothetical protein